MTTMSEFITRGIHLLRAIGIGRSAQSPANYAEELTEEELVEEIRRTFGVEDNDCTDR